jgi:hypothetical protein
MPDAELAPLNALVGDWTYEATHPAVPDTVVHGRSTFEWLEGERFLIQRSVNDHPDFPDGILVIGRTDDHLRLHYFDSRGVHRIYEVELIDGEVRFARDEPGFAQRFIGTFSDDGDTFGGVWQLSTDDATWADDLAIEYRRA